MKDCREKIIGIFNEHCISNYNLNYYPEIFGNVACEVEYNEKKYCTVTDRGEIILNGKSIKDASYLESGISTIEVLEKIILDILNQ